MYAVIETGGKQYRVQVGDILQIEKLEGDEGSKIRFDQILLISKQNGEQPEVLLGKPYVSKAFAEARIVGQGRGDKIVVFKRKRRTQYKRTQGHRQYYTQVLIVGIDNGAGIKAELSESDMSAKLVKFQSHLKPKGPAFQTKKLGSRVRLKGGPQAVIAAKKKAMEKKTSPVASSGSIKTAKAKTKRTKASTKKA